MKSNFVVVAHDEKVRETLAGALSTRGYSVTRAKSGRQAEQIVRSVAVDAVVIESHLSDMPPEELRMRIARLRPDCRVVVMTHYGQVRNTPEQLRHDGNEFLLRAAEAVDLIEGPFAAARSAESSGFASRGHDALIAALDVVVGLVELDQRHFGGFSHHAMVLARDVACELGSDEEVVREIVVATLLRDLGRLVVEDDLLREKGLFTAEQRERMKAHVEGSLAMFEHIDFPWKVLPVIRHHHERYDGKGYPEGLRGREIPLGARIVAVVDAFVALVSRREHREPLDVEQALATITVEAGRQFDPEVVEAFQKVLDARRLATPRGERPTVLIVAARDAQRKALKIRLVNGGFEVRETRSARRALARTRRHAPALLLVDLDLDPAAAFRLLRDVREDASVAHTPMAFLTAQSDRMLKLRALREGVDDLLSKDEDLETIVARAGNIVSREALRREGRVARPRRGITGELENLGLADIVQVLSMGMKTACVTLRAGKGEGKIWFDNGTVRHAEVGGSQGEPAFFEMVRWVSGQFVIEHGERTETRTIESDAMYLVMEGMRLMDEASSERSAV